MRRMQIVGVTTDVCVLSTVKDAIERGYDVLLLKDGSATAEEEIHDAVVRSVQMEGGIAGCVAKVDDVIEALRLNADETSTR
jgi:nicotinamidase-related amidase